MCENTILFIGAHPDDIALGCAISVRDHFEKKDRVKTIVLTIGEKGSGGELLNRGTEEVNSIQVLAPGSENIVLDFPDTMLSNHIAEIISTLRKIVLDDMPYAVYIPSRHDFHQDHVATYQSAMAVFNNLNIGKIICYETPSTLPTFSPNYFKVYRAEDFKMKSASLSCHLSQSKKGYISSEMLYSIGKMRAAQSRHHDQLAEAFEIVRISEPISSKEVFDWN